MQTAFYPPITATNLAPFRALKALLDKDPAYLDKPECPYEPDVKAFVRQMLGSALISPTIALETPDDLEDQLETVYSDLMAFKKDLAKADSNEKIQWAKAVVGILDRIIAMKERVHNVKNYSDFQKRVIELLEVTMEPAQRSDFVERLGKYLHE